MSLRRLAELQWHYGDFTGLDMYLREQRLNSKHVGQDEVAPPMRGTEKENCVSSEAES